MQVEAIYNSGKLEFVQPLQLRHQRFRVVVTVPDHEVDLPEPQDARPSSLPADLVERAKANLARMEAIKNAPLAAAEEIPELTEKQLDRIEAAALRDEIKGLR